MLCVPDVAGLPDAGLPDAGSFEETPSAGFLGSCPSNRPSDNKPIPIPAP
jgi:hypothetical protein